jgi:hypothetical protein
MTSNTPNDARLYLIEDERWAPDIRLTEPERERLNAATDIADPFREPIHTHPDSRPLGCGS